MKRLFCIIGSLLVCTSSVFAWNAESFLADGSSEFQPYVSEDLLDDPIDEPLLASGYSLRATPSVPDNEIKEVDFTSADILFGANYSSDITISLLGTYDYNIGNIATGTLQGILDSTSQSVYMPSSSTYYAWRTNQVSLVPDWLSSSIPDSRVIDGLQSQAALWHFDLDIDRISNSLEFSINIPAMFVRMYGSNNAFDVTRPVYMDLYVNDHFQKRYNFTTVGTSASLDVANEIVSLNNPIDSAYFEIYVPPAEWAAPSNLSTVNSVPAIWWAYIHNTSFIKYSLLNEGSLSMNDIHNQQAGDALDEHSSIESEWSGSMIDNFNELDLGSFSYPDGLVSAFVLISGIFNDLWNGMGEYKILYVFPLTLGVTLLIVGRISKFGGQEPSSGKRGKSGGPSARPSRSPKGGG